MASPLINYAVYTTLPADPTPEELEQWLKGGRSVLRDAATPVRLWDVLQSGRSTEVQRRTLLGRVIDGAKVQLADLARWLADNLERGLSTLNGWWKKFAGIAGTHNYAGVMAALGTPDPTPADIQSADGQVRKQLGFLGRFREQLRIGAQPVFAEKPDPETGVRVVNGRFVLRSALYGDAAWSVANNVIREKMIREGYTLERRILGGSHHCIQCIDEAKKGFQPIGTLLPIGETICRTNCRCRWEFDHTLGRKIIRSIVGNRPK